MYWSSISLVIYPLFFFTHNNYCCFIKHVPLFPVLVKILLSILASHTCDHSFTGCGSLESVVALQVPLWALLVWRGLAAALTLPPSSAAGHTTVIMSMRPSQWAAAESPTRVTACCLPQALSILPQTSLAVAQKFTDNDNLFIHVSCRNDIPYDNV